MHIYPSRKARKRICKFLPFVRARRQQPDNKSPLNKLCTQLDENFKCLSLSIVSAQHKTAESYGIGWKKQ